MDFLNMLKGVLGQVKACPEAEAAAAMRNACAEFLTETRCMLGDDVIATDGTVPALADMLSQVVDVVEASIEGEDVHVTYYNDPALRDLGPTDWRLTFKEPSGELTLTPTPPAAVNLRLIRILSVGPEAIQVADWVWRSHSEALTHGCLARLLAMANKPWADGAAAVFHETKFREAITRVAASHSVNRKQVARRLRVKPA
ncbi:MAG TPA: hypothetical protein VGF12_07005 [Roseateles sp.]|uniref:phage adaptor protein n=1 Tax=Roseateles sp. TaxID=1971397 RepID=UPI002ED94BE2